MDNKRDVQSQFGKSAENYVHSSIHKEGKDLIKLVEITEMNGKENLLDIATGGGHTANAYAPFVKRVTAFDLTVEMLAAAERFIRGNGHHNVNFVRGDAENLPFPDETFEIVTCRIAPHHFPNVLTFIKEAWRVLKPNGQLLLDDNVVPEDDELDQFYNTIEKRRDYSHFRAWKKTEWLRMLEFQGFIVAEWHRFEKTFYFEPWCKRMDLSVSDRNYLSQYILDSSQKVKDHFKIVAENEQIVSFQGEAMVLRAVKRK